MTKSKFRKILAGSIVFIYLLIGLLSGIYVDFIEVLKSMTLPVTVVLGGYFGRHIANEFNTKKEKEKEEDIYG